MKCYILRIEAVLRRPVEFGQHTFSTHLLQRFRRCVKAVLVRLGMDGWVSPARVSHLMARLRLTHE